MAKPGILCHLKKDTLIDTNEGFVDTFNWMVDYINNLRGDDSYIELQNPTGENPVIRYKTEDEQSSSALSGSTQLSVKCIDYDGTESYTTVLSGMLTLSASPNTNMTFTTQEDGTIGIEVKYL